MSPRTLALSALAFAACAPELPPDDGLIRAPRVLAVRADAPEAKPGAAVAYTALVATPGELDGEPSVAWDYCLAPKPPAENNVVSSSCLDESALAPAGIGVAITAAIPKDACSRFGPDTPPGGFRPRDPDATGGYYQPLRAELEDAPPAFHLERLLCDLGMAPSELAAEFASEYVPNENPHLEPLTASVAGNAVSLDAIPAGARVTLVASWPADDTETFAYYDRASQSITTQRESMRVAWYVTAGTLAEPTTGHAEDDPASSSANAWMAPDHAGTTRLWLVLSDSRGGSDFASYELTASP